MTTSNRESSRGRRGYIYAVFAVITCPCHLPILVILFSGSAMGAFLSDHFAMALTIFSLLFGVSLIAALRTFRNHEVHDN